MNRKLKRINHKAVALGVLLIILILTPFAAKAENFAPGYIVTNTGDTLYGQIDLRTNIINQEKCVFKKHNEISVYSPFEIQSYFFTAAGKYYVSKTIEIKGKTINAFVEFLLKGMMSLYYFEIEELENTSFEYYDNNPISKYFLFEKEDGTTLLIDKRPDKFHGQSQIQSDARYKGKIRLTFDSIKPIADNYEKIDFTPKSMINIARLYHNAVCTTGEECIVFETTDKQSIKTQFSLYAGWQMMSYEFVKFGVIRSSLPEIGAQLNFSYPRWQKFLSLQLDISLSQLNGKKQLGNNMAYGYFNRYFKYHAMIAESKLGVKYTYPKGKIRPSAEMGIGISYFFATLNTYHYEEIDPLSIHQIYDVDYSSVIAASFVLEYYAGAGLDYQLKNNHFLLFRMTYDNEIHYGRKKAWQLKLGYTF